MLMGVGRHIKDRQETSGACNADKSSSQLLFNAPVRNYKLAVYCLVYVCVWLCEGVYMQGCSNFAIKVNMVS